MQYADGPAASESRLLRALIGPAPGEHTGRSWIPAAVVGLVLAASWILAWVAGGAAAIPPHLFYVPVTLAAVRLRYLGGLIAGLVAGILSGPALPLDVASGQAQSPVDWLVRTIGLVSAGLAMAWVIDRFRDVQVRLRSTQQVVEALMGGTSHRVISRRDFVGGRRRVENALRGDSLQMVFQPIVDLRTGQTSGYEALSRFETKPKRPPNEWFAEAWEVGLGIELELFAVRKVLADLKYLPPGYVSFNLSPLAVLSPEFRSLIPKLPYGRFVIEMTEHVPVPDYDALVKLLSELRMRGLRVAVDDAGAGYASFRHILRLAPDMIKLDMSLVRGVDRDEALRSLAQAVTTFATQMGAQVVAEGIETEGELQALKTLGVGYGQSWEQFGAPQPASRLRYVTPG